MQNRILEFLKAENISQSQFADEIGVARASVSHIISGRNKPGCDFIARIISHYPALNLDWLLIGSGSMYKTQGSVSSSDTQPESPEKRKDVEEHKTTEQEVIQETVPVCKKTIVKIIALLSDGTFQELTK